MVLSAKDCAKAVALVEDGRSQRYAARLLSVSQSTVQRVLQRFRQTARNTQRPGSGIKWATAVQNDTSIFLHSLQNQYLTSVQTKNRLLENRYTYVSK